MNRTNKFLFQPLIRSFQRVKKRITTFRTSKNLQQIVSLFPDEKQDLIHEMIQQIKSEKRINQIKNDSTLNLAHDLIQRVDTLLKQNKKTVKKTQVLEIYTELKKLHGRVESIDRKLKNTRLRRVSSQTIDNNRVYETDNIITQFKNKSWLKFNNSTFSDIKETNKQIDEFFKQKSLVERYKEKLKKRRVKVNQLNRDIKKLIGRKKFSQAWRGISELETLLERDFNGFHLKELDSLKKKADKEEAKHKRNRENEAKRKLDQEKRKLDQEKKKKEFIENLKPIPPGPNTVTAKGKITRDPAIKQYLRENNIHCLYHFTDEGNIASIKKYGLHSHESIEKHGLSAKHGSNEWSRKADKKKKLGNYVRLSFNSTIPQKHTAETTRGVNACILEINPKVCELYGSKFADGNANSRDVNIGEGLNSLKKIILKYATDEEIYSNKWPYKTLFRHKQSEVLVLQSIPTKYITNIHEL